MRAVAVAVMVVVLSAFGLAGFAVAQAPEYDRAEVVTDTGQVYQVTSTDDDPYPDITGARRYNIGTSTSNGIAGIVFGSYTDAGVDVEVFVPAQSVDRIVRYNEQS